jgi:hypothetical protein
MKKINFKSDDYYMFSSFMENYIGKIISVYPDKFVSNIYVFENNQFKIIENHITELNWYKYVTIIDKSQSDDWMLSVTKHAIKNIDYEIEHLIKCKKDLELFKIPE